MQANQIQKIMDLKPLTDIKHLKKLVLFGMFSADTCLFIYDNICNFDNDHQLILNPSGNPVEESKHYRNMIFYLCPRLSELDYTPITASQRKKNEVWQLVFRKKLHPEDFE